MKFKKLIQGFKINLTRVYKYADAQKFDINVQIINLK